MADILVIDDDNDICRMIQRALTSGKGATPDCTVTIRNSAVGLTARELNTYDLVLLDVMMPQMDGFTFCRQMRPEVDCPILFLTAKTMEQDVVDGFALGADDYIRKPFALSELRARVAAHLRRETREHRQVLCIGELRFDLSAKTLSVRDRAATEQEVPLTKSEYAICEYLARHKGSVYTLEQILEAVLGYESESDNAAIRVHVKNIRAKLGHYGQNPIETVWGVGYKWK